MRYDVTYQVGGEEFVERVEAPDAASAASIVQTNHARDEGMFELISVTLLDDIHHDHASNAEHEDQADPIGQAK